VSYHWDLGDATTADGPSVQHSYAAGTYTATVTAAGADGETATAQVAIRAVGVSLAGPHTASYGHALRLAGAVVPPAVGVRVAVTLGSRIVARTSTVAGGRFHVRTRALGPGPWLAHAASAVSAPLAMRVHPELVATVVGNPMVGEPLTVVARLRPAAAGHLSVGLRRTGHGQQIRRGGASVHVRLDTHSAAQWRAVVTAQPARGWLGAMHVLHATVVEPTLGPGSRGPSVRVLEQRLASLHYALRGVDASYDSDTSDAVLAFQKLYGLPRTGRVDSRLWRLLVNAHTPRARYSGNHVEVDKTRQVLFEVRGGKVALIVHVSTGATGNTPLGEWHVYRRVPGWDWVLYYPSYFLRGFAIHGYPDVPPYPASHGCVRVPLWAATRLYSLQWYGEAVYVYA
jgi:L,D-transpeptidase-like protein/putative peptidoglycan binding protein/PKD domain-containing protein